MEPFPFAGLIQESNNEALSYAYSNLDISKRPAAGWNGASKTALDYTVKNNGNQEISVLTIRLVNNDGSTVDVPLKGPFPARQTATGLVTVPPNVSPACLAATAVDTRAEVVGARF
jgi:hypothetical protein